MSARRLLLIDADAEFHRVLHQQLSPYGFEIHLVDEGDDPLGQVREIDPVIIFIAVEEPDKVGYALCNKAKKGVAKDIPVVLTTRSVPKKGFNSHRKLRVHADAYIDKRGMGDEDVLNTVDQLLALGEPDDIEIPVDVEEISIDDIEVDVEIDEEDVAIDEIELDDVIDDFAGGEKTSVAAPQMLIDADLDAETDAAFAFLTDDPAEDEPPAAPVSEAGPPPPPVAEPEQETQVAAIPEPVAAEPVPESEPETLVAPVPDPEPVLEIELGEPEPEPVMEIEEPEPEPVMEIEEPEPEPVMEIEEPEPEPVMEMEIEEPAVELPEPEPVMELEEPAPEIEQPAAASAKPAALVDASDDLDLGLDAVAEMAVEEQSGVHDRRTIM